MAQSFVAFTGRSKWLKGWIWRANLHHFWPQTTGVLFRRREVSRKEAAEKEGSGIESATLYAEWNRVWE